MEENPSVTPSPLAPHPHKEFFILGSIFTVFMLLVASGILYFQNDSAPLVQEADQQDLEILKEFYSGQAAGLSYSKDKNYVYVGKEIINGADPNTFEFLPGTKEEWGVSQQFARDKNHIYDIYLAGLVVKDADIFSFKQLNYMYAKDKNYVYSRNWSMPDSEFGVIEGADPITFQLSSTTNSFDAQDKNHRYLMGKIVATTTEQN